VEDRIVPRNLPVRDQFIADSFRMRMMTSIPAGTVPDGSAGSLQTSS